MILDSWQLQQCRIHGQLFCIPLEKSKNPKQFVETYMHSDIAVHMDNDCDSMHIMGQYYLFECISDDYGLEDFNSEYDLSEELFWMGYLYRFWHFYTGESSVEIYKQANYDDMLDYYLGYHTLSPQMAVDRIKEANEMNASNKE